jgi:hypothetical protein
MGEVRKKRAPKEFCPQGHSRIGNINKDFSCKTCKQDRSRLEKYGITAEQYNLLLEKQEGKCFICLCKPRSKSLAVDHDHKCCKARQSCGKCIRGLLCMRCNHVLLGAAKEDPEVLLRAADYLTNPPAQRSD